MRRDIASAGALGVALTAFGVNVSASATEISPNDCAVVSPAEASCTFTAGSDQGNYSSSVDFTLTSDNPEAAGAGTYAANPGTPLQATLTAGEVYTVTPTGPGVVIFGG